MEKRNDDGLIEQKLDFYIQEKIMVHIELLNKKFLNARIIEKKSPGIYIINERKLGLMHLFEKEIYRISEFVEGKDAM